MFTIYINEAPTNIEIYFKGKENVKKEQWNGNILINKMDTIYIEVMFTSKKIDQCIDLIYFSMECEIN